MDSLNCPFCSAKKEDVILQNELWFTKWDKYPVSKGHLLIIPIRHVSSYFDTTKDEKYSLIEIVDDCKRFLDDNFHPDGYNIGINSGKAAGQTVMHLHIHIIPRYYGDMMNPEGGVRGVIPQKRRY